MNVHQQNVDRRRTRRTRLKIYELVLLDLLQNLFYWIRSLCTDSNPSFLVYLLNEYLQLLKLVDRPSLYRGQRSVLHGVIMENLVVHLLHVKIRRCAKVGAERWGPLVGRPGWSADRGTLPLGPCLVRQVMFASLICSVVVFGSDTPCSYAFVRWAHILRYYFTISFVILAHHLCISKA